MKGKTGLIIAGVIVVLLLITGVVVYKTVFSGSPVPAQTTDVTPPAEIPAADASIQVNLTKSTATANAVVISVKGMAKT